jgi:teichoic acid transport system permease protein
MTDTAVTEARRSYALGALALKYGLRPAGRRPSLGEYAGQLWRYRHFIVAYANGRLIASFTSARLGRLWQVLTPITNAAVYYLIFGVILGTSKGIDHFIAYLCTGLFVFGFTQTVAMQGVAAISGNLGLVRALHFPRACLPIAVTLSQFQSLLFSIVVLIGIVIANGVPVTAQWALLVPALLLQSLFNAGLALIVARLGSAVTDLKQVLPFIMRTWMYASGVFYAIGNFKDNLPRVVYEIMLANPLLVYIELARDALLPGTPISSSSQQLWLLGVAWAVVVALGGFVFFWRAEEAYGRG